VSKWFACLLKEIECGGILELGQCFTGYGVKANDDLLGLSRMTLVGGVLDYLSKPVRSVGSVSEVVRVSDFLLLGLLVFWYASRCTRRWDK
jgi:hypothetical protein